MADNITINSRVHATDDVGGVHYPYVKMAYGAPDSATPMDTKPATEAAQTLGVNELTTLNSKVKANAQTTALGVGVSSSLLDVITGTASSAAINIDLLTNVSNGWLDVSAYSSAALMFVTSGGISAGQITIEQTQDSSISSVGVNLFAYDTASLSNAPAAVYTLSASTTKIVRFPITTKYIRVRVNTAVTGGTVQAVIGLSQRPFTNHTLQVNQSTASSFNAMVSGPTAHSSASTTHPVMTGGVVKTAASTTEVAGDVCRSAMSASGALITMPFSVPDLNWVGSVTIVDTAVTALKAAGASSIRNYLIDFDYQNTSAVATVLEVRDGASTVLWRGYAAANMTVPVAVNFLSPKKGTAATALNVVAITTGANIYVNAGGYSDV